MGASEDPEYWPRPTRWRLELFVIPLALARVGLDRGAFWYAIWMDKTRARFGKCFALGGLVYIRRTAHPPTCMVFISSVAQRGRWVCGDLNRNDRRSSSLRCGTTT